MDTIVNHKPKETLQVSWAENTPAVWQVATAQKTPDSTIRLLGVVSGQAIAVRRAAPERRSKLTWPVTPDSTASNRGLAGHPTKPETPP